MIVCLKFPEKLLRQVLELETNVIVVRDAYDVAHEPVSAELRSRLRGVYEIGRLDSIEEMSAVYVDIALTYPGRVRAVLSGAEYGMFGAAYLRTAFGIDEREPDLTIIARDKRWMKKAFADAGLPCAKIISNYRPGDEVPASMFPVVAKPVAGTGSFNTAVLDDRAALDAFIASEKLHPALVSSQWAIEEKLDGDEYHVDMIWRDGEIVFTSVGRYLMPRLAAVQTPSRNGSVILSPVEHAGLYDTFRELMARFGASARLTSGITHAEFFVDADGRPYLSEVATRFAGAAIPQAIRAAFGVDIIDAWMRTELGLEPDVAGHPDDHRFAGQLSVTPATSGEVLAVPSAGDYLTADGVVEVAITVAVGDTYRHDNPSNWCVLVVITAADEREFLDRCDDVYAKLPVRV